MKLKICEIGWCTRPVTQYKRVCITCYKRNWERRVQRGVKGKRRDVSLDEAFLDLDRLAYSEWMEGEFLE